MKSRSILALIAITLVLLYPLNAFAVIDNEETRTISPINEKLSLEKTVTTMNVPQDITLFWGTIRGEPSDYAERYPVIIQFFKGEEPVHVAQVKVKGDGSYEYKFRIRNIDQSTDQIIDIFKGEYTVKIFRVINNQN
jgi:hypothetical protein